MAKREYTPTAVESVCTTCGNTFAYLHSTGMRKRHCGEVCRVKNQMARAKIRKGEYPKCTADGCMEGATRVTAGLCEKHYGRVRRGAPLTDRIPTHKYRTQAGYIVALDPEHPLAMVDGRVFEHRRVAYKKHNGECPNCFWCGVALGWTNAVTDHLDENKQNNEACNLVIACSPCNRARGAMLPFLASITSEAMPAFIEQMMKYRDKQREEQGIFKNS